MANVLIGHVKGPQGDAATVAVGTVTTGAAGSSAAVTNSGTSSAATLNFTIPKGDKGDPGDPGVTDYATASAAGLVRVGDDFNINSSNGTLSIKDEFTEASTLANISSGESHATILGKIKKFMSTLMPSTFVKDNVISTDTDKALSAKQGKMLAEIIANVQDSHTASKAYSVGDYIIMDSKLYIVTSPIANGGTITSGTNVGGTSLGSRLKLTNERIDTGLNGVSFLNTVFNSSSAMTFSLSSGYRGLFIITTSSNAGSGMYILYANNSGTVGTETINENTLVTLNVATTNKLTLSATSGTYQITFITFAGTVTVDS